MSLFQYIPIPASVSASLSLSYLNTYMLPHFNTLTLLHTPTLYSQWIESSVIIEQGSLNVSISSAFQEILRAQRSLCSQNATSSSTFPASGAASASSSVSSNTLSRRYYEGEEEYRLRRQGITQGQGQGQRQGQGSRSVGVNSTRRILTSDNQEEEIEEERMKGSGTNQSPHATICGKHPAIRIYHRKGKGNSEGKDKGGDQNGSSADSSSGHKGELLPFF